MGEERLDESKTPSARIRDENSLLKMNPISLDERHDFFSTFGSSAPRDMTSLLNL
jgi:hypothetical protein